MTHCLVDKTMTVRENLLENLRSKVLLGALVQPGASTIIERALPSFLQKNIGYLVKPCKDGRLVSRLLWYKGNSTQ